MIGNFRSMSSPTPPSPPFWGALGAPGGQGEGRDVRLWLKGQIKKKELNGISLGTPEVSPKNPSTTTRSYAFHFPIPLSFPIQYWDSLISVCIPNGTSEVSPSHPSYSSFFSPIPNSYDQNVLSAIALNVPMTSHADTPFPSLRAQTAQVYLPNAPAVSMQLRIKIILFSKARTSSSSEDACAIAARCVALHRSLDCILRMDTHIFGEYHLQRTDNRGNMPFYTLARIGNQGHNCMARL